MLSIEAKVLISISMKRINRLKQNKNNLSAEYQNIKNKNSKFMNRETYLQ